MSSDLARRRLAAEIFFFAMAIHPRAARYNAGNCVWAKPVFPITQYRSGPTMLLTSEQRNDRFAIISALQSANPDNPLVRAVIGELQQMDRRAREQIAFIGDIPDCIYMPPLSDETERVALAIWAGKFHHAISCQVQSEIQAALELRQSLACMPQEPRTVWLI
jgi:hypothetical protein